VPGEQVATRELTGQRMREPHQEQHAAERDGLADGHQAAQHNLLVAE